MIFKKSFFIAIICLYGISLQSQNIKGFVLTGELKGLPDKTKVYLRTQEHDTVASAISIGERFSFQGKLENNGRFHFIAIDSSVSKVITKAIFLENRQIVVKGIVGIRKVTVTGAPAHVDYQELVTAFASFDSLRKKITILKLELGPDIKTAKLKNDSGKLKSLREKQSQLRKEEHEIVNKKVAFGKKWIAAHPNSLYTPYAILGHESVLTVEEMQNALKKLKPAAKESYYGLVLQKTINNLRLSGRIGEGTIIPNFTLTYPDRTTAKIQDIAAKNRVTLIDCWASWCKPCRAAIPELKEVYSMYKDKGFMILSISTDKNESLWRKAMAEDNVPWINGWQGQNRIVTKLFDMKAIPTYILIDNTGKLIAFDCALSSIPSFGGNLKNDALIKKLQELLD